MPQGDLEAWRRWRRASGVAKQLKQSAGGPASALRQRESRRR